MKTIQIYVFYLMNIDINYAVNILLRNTKLNLKKKGLKGGRYEKYKNICILGKIIEIFVRFKIKFDFWF